MRPKVAAKSSGRPVQMIRPHCITCVPPDPDTVTEYGPPPEPTMFNTVELNSQWT